MKHMLRLAILACLACGAALAQTTDELVNDGRNADNVTTQSMGYARRSYSPLNQINAKTVKRLVPVWSASLMNDMGELAAPTAERCHVRHQRQGDVRDRRRQVVALAYGGGARAGRSSAPRSLEARRRSTTARSSA